MISQRVEKPATISIERLREDKDALARFLTEDPKVKVILATAIRAVNKQKEISVEELTNVLFLEAVTNDRSWITKNLDNIYSYLKKTVRNFLIGNSSSAFFKDYFGYDPKFERKGVSIDTPKTDEDRSLEERIPAPDIDSESEQGMTAEEKIESFKHVIKLVTDKKPDYGELLYRYYIDQEKMRDIAIDFLKRGLIGGRRYEEHELTEKIIDDAEKNLQNAKLRRAREKFNEIALSANVNLRLEGKIKKSMLKGVKTAAT